MRATIRRKALAFRSNQYVVAIGTTALVVVAIWLAISALTRSADTVIIEVVPLPDPTNLRVQVIGEVGQPGVYILSVGSTVDDAVAAAGGFNGESTLPEDRMASLLNDGDVIDVPAVDAAPAPESGPVNINTASTSELERLPGIGPAIAGRIVSYRNEHGRFQSVEELSNVSGISERMVNEMRHLITVES